jgi:hypothetical protein
MIIVRPGIRSKNESAAMDPDEHRKLFPRRVARRLRHGDVQVQAFQIRMDHRRFWNRLLNEAHLVVEGGWGVERRRPKLRVSQWSALNEYYSMASLFFLSLLSKLLGPEKPKQKSRKTGKTDGIERTHAWWHPQNLPKDTQF